MVETKTSLSRITSLIMGEGGGAGKRVDRKRDAKFRDGDKTRRTAKRRWAEKFPNGRRT